MKTVVKAIRQTPLFILCMVALLAALFSYLFLPAREFSLLENRPLAQLDAPQGGSVRSGACMRRADSYINDQFPLRDALLGLGALKDAALLKTERNGVLLGQDGRLFDRVDELKPGALADNLSAMQALGQAASLPVELLMIPLTAQVYPQQLPAFYPAQDVAALAQPLLDKAQVRIIDPLAQLQQAAKTEPLLYYRTDHHLTAGGADVAYRALCAAWGLTPNPMPRTLAQPGFYGSFFARAPSPLIAPDTLTFAYPDVLRVSVDGQAKEGLWEDTLLARPNKYAALLYNNPGRLTLVNPSGQGVLVVVRDSYASALLPAIASHFARVEAIDPRYFQGGLAAFCQQQQAERILCIYGINALLNDRNLPRLAAALPR